MKVYLAQVSPRIVRAGELPAFKEKCVYNFPAKGWTMHLYVFSASRLYIYLKKGNLRADQISTSIPTNVGNRVEL